MAEETLDEPVGVTAEFQAAEIRPLRIVRKSGACAVVRIHARWVLREGRHAIYHFSIETDGGDLFDLSLHTGSMSWRLERVFLP